MRQFRKSTGRSTRAQVWFVGRDPKDKTAYITKWGLLDGALQETRDVPGPCGTVGHSDYQTAEEYVDFCIEREIRKKKEQGYVEYVDNKPIEKVATSFNFSSTLPKNMCFYKPQKSIADEKLKDLEQGGNAIWTLKRDGMMHIAYKTDDWDIYSRRMDLVTDKYPHIVESLSRLNIPNNTILLGEFVLPKKDGTDNFTGVSKICRSDKELALAYQGIISSEKVEVLGKILYYVFDVAFYNGKDLISSIPIGKRFGLLRNIFSVFDDRLSINTGLKAEKGQILFENKLRDEMLKNHYVAPLKIYKTNTENDIKLAKELRVEGFVVVDARASYGDKAYSFDGKAQRPNGIWKRKPKYEEEFIVVDIYEGAGRNMGMLGGFEIEQIHPETGERIYCGRCGGGFTNEDRLKLWNKKVIGKTVKIEFDSRQPPKDGVYALRFPEFIGFSDKTPEECFAQFLDGASNE